jgi:hypothetical protein
MIAALQERKREGHLNPTARFWSAAVLRRFGLRRQAWQQTPVFARISARRIMLWHHPDAEFLC